MNAEKTEILHFNPKEIGQISFRSFAINTIEKIKYINCITAKRKIKISTKCCREDKEIELQTQTLVTEAFDNGRENPYYGNILSITNYL